MKIAHLHSRDGGVHLEAVESNWSSRY